MKYNCFWGDTTNPVEDEHTRMSLQNNLTAAINEFLSDVQGDEFWVMSTDESVVWLDDEGTGNMDGEGMGMDMGPDFEGSSFDEGEGGEDSRLDAPRFSEPLDSREWSATRYLGLALFLLVSIPAVLLAHIGATRRRRRIRKQVWSNLASEEGIKDLLKTGWVLKGNRMEVYDKGRRGYKDNDSMLIGGFEQKEALVGCEITVDSLYSPGTRSGNSRNFSSSEFPASTGSHAASGQETERETAPEDQNTSTK